MVEEQIKVELLDSMGSDIDVVNAARVSFGKESRYDMLGWKESYDDCGNVLTRTPLHKLNDNDAKLIRYLAEHSHWSPFAHCFVKFRVKAPIFVARQLQKHTVGLAWNEVSRRYVDSEPTFYFPETWRKRCENKKQGSSDESVELGGLYYKEDESGCVFFPDEIVASSLSTYKALLEEGVCPEQARMVLPQNMMTEWIWSGSLYAFARVVKLRQDAHAQRETAEVAGQIDKCMVELFPISWPTLMKG